MELHLTQILLDTIDKYIKGELEGEQLLNFEKKLEENPSLKEEMLIQKSLFKAISTDDNDSNSIPDEDLKTLQEKINDPEYQALSKKIKDIGSEYIQNPVSEKKPLWIRFKKMIPAAAAILLLVVISTVYLVNSSQSIDQYYYDNVNWETELVSFAEKGNAKSDFTKAEEFFNAKDYTRAIQSFETINQEDELYPYSLLYLGASHTNLNQDQEAIKAFNDLAQMKEFGESSKGLWYAALIHLKNKDKANAIKVLNIIEKDTANYRYETAIQILKELE